MWARKGTRKFNRTMDKDPMWDKEFFQCQMKTMRGWEHEESEPEWMALKDNPLVHHDMSGPRKAPLCLAIPAWLVGGRARERGTENFESRKALTKSHKMEMDQDETDQLVSDCRRGFSRLSDANSADTGMDVAKSSVAFNDLSAPRPKDILIAVAKSAPATASDASQDEMNAPVAGSPQASPPHERHSLVDISKLQRDALRHQGKVHKEDSARFWKEINLVAVILEKACAHEHFGSCGTAKSDVELVKIRFAVALAFMERHPKKKEDGADDYSIKKDTRQGGHISVSR